MNGKLLFWFVLDVFVILLLVHAAFLWLLSPLHQLSQQQQQVVAVGVMIRIVTLLFVQKNSDDDLAGQF